MPYRYCDAQAQNGSACRQPVNSANYKKRREGKSPRSRSVWMKEELPDAFPSIMNCPGLADGN